MKRAGFYVQHILEAIAAVEALVEDGWDRVLSERRTRSSLAYELLTLADAASLLAEEYGHDYPGIPWRKVKAFRNRLAHGYLDLDFAAIRRTVDADLPELKVAMETLWESLPEDQLPQP